jgi:hypothetical protein
MQVLQKLVAEDDIGDASGQVEVVAVIDDEVEVRRDGVRWGALVGDVHADDTIRQRGRCVAESAVTWSELHQCFIRTEERAQQTELAVHLTTAVFRGVATCEAGMVGNALKEFIVQFLEQSGTLLPSAAAQPGGEFFFNLEMVAETIGGAGHVQGNWGLRAELNGGMLSASSWEVSSFGNEEGLWNALI